MIDLLVFVISMNVGRKLSVAVRFVLLCKMAGLEALYALYKTEL